MVEVVPIMMFMLFIPLVFGLLFVGLIVFIVRRTTSYHESRQMDMRQLQNDIAEIRKELQEIKENLADLTIQLDDARFRKLG